MKLALVALIVFAGAAAALSAPPAPPPRTHQGPLLPRAGFLNLLFAAQRQLAADYYWILTTHQIGAARTVEEAADVYAYADLATDLDPRFRPVYWFAGVATVVAVDRDRYENVDLSNTILRKGLSRFPNNFPLGYQLAQNYLHYVKDYRKAADLLAALAKLPDAPDWLPSLAARLYSQTGLGDSALELAKQMLASAKDDETRALYTLRLKEIRQEMILRRVDREIERFKEKEGRPPVEFYELVKMGYLPGLPADPLGGAYYIDPKDGRAHSNATRHRFELLTPKLE